VPCAGGRCDKTPETEQAPEMINKNLRSVLYYVIGVTLVCLMIELSKRTVPGGGLSSQLYVVETAKESELATLPNSPAGEVDYDIVPKRDRGRVKEPKKPRELVADDTLSENTINTIEDTRSNREKFKEWKASVKISADEMGLFKKWKLEQGLSKKQLKEKEAAAFKDEDVTEKVEELDIDDAEETGNIKEDHKPSTDEKVEEEYAAAGDDIDTEELIDYPDGLTEYEPPNFEHSCSDFTLTDELLERSKSVQAACSRLQDELGDQRKLFSRLRWAVPERLLYCPVFKAASTSWLINYLKLSNSTSDPKNGNLHTKITNLFPPPATFKLRKQIFSESIKFIIVRHPFERLVSAYRDKLAGFSRNEHYLSMRKHIIQKYRKRSKDKSAIPSFRESVDFVLDELKKMEAGVSKIMIDGHFMPYSRRCIPCAMNYDVIIKFETLEQDSQYLIDQCQLGDKLAVVHENPAPTGARTEQGQKNKSKKVKTGKSLPDKSASSSFQSLDFFKDIPDSKIKQLYEHYRHDFEIFGYSVSEYLQDS